MKRKAAETGRKQGVVPSATSVALQQLELPMMMATEAIRKGLLAFVQQMGMLAFREMLEAEAEEIAERGLRIDAPLLFAIDGGKGIRKALTEVFGDRAIVQRCQVHKARNVRDHLPQERRAYVQRQMREAYQNKSAKTAKKMLLQLASWLETNGEDSAASSLREGLDETPSARAAHHPLQDLRDDQRDRKHERHSPSGAPQRETLAGRGDDQALGRPRRRRGAARIPPREGAWADEPSPRRIATEDGGG
jgi:Transposase, Mutator family